MENEKSITQLLQSFKNDEHSMTETLHHICSVCEFSVGERIGVLNTDYTDAVHGVIKKGSDVHYACHLGKFILHTLIDDHISHIMIAKDELNDKIYFIN